jgi:DNA-binding NtrC family response regulator
MTGNILIVDDNRAIRDSLQMLLQTEFDEVDVLPDPKSLLSTLEKKKYDILLLDMNFRTGINTGNEGLFWLKEVQKHAPDLCIILITAYGDVELAVKAVKEGAFDFVLKPWDNNKLLTTMFAAMKYRDSARKNSELKNDKEILQRTLERQKKSMIGESKAIREVINLIAKVAPTQANVLIQGENGSGKELVARDIHEKSTRRKEVFVSVDLGAMSESLFESELFGHVKGAFTDAKTNRKGKIEDANKGTLFLDEIGNLSLSMQAKLLTVLQNKKLSPLGTNKEVHVDFRLVCATNKNLFEMVRNGEFREDLLYRINTITVEVPPLREREGDILLLAEYFLNKFSLKYGKGKVVISKENADIISKWNWPGNVRELEHCMEKAIILSDNNELYINPGTNVLYKEKTESVQVQTIEEMEEKLIIAALEESKGNLSHAAKSLGITRPTLYNKMKKYNL